MNILITGGSGGLGHSLCRTFFNLGHDVHFTYAKNKAAADQLLQELNCSNVTSSQLDLSSYEAIESFVHHLETVPDILIHNAAVGSSTVDKWKKLKYEQDEVMFKVNSLGPLWLSEMLIEKMEQKKKAVIAFISSVGGGITHFKGFRSSDGMSKAALTFFSSKLAAQLVHSPIDVVTFCPGALDTEMLRKSTLNHLTEEQRVDLVESLPKSRLISPDNMAQVIASITTKNSELFHGAVIDNSQGLGVEPGLI